MQLFKKLIVRAKLGIPQYATILNIFFIIIYLNMFSLFKHIDIDCVYQLKTSSIFLPVLHVYLLAFLRCLYQSQIITLKQELVPLSIFKICIGMYSVSEFFSSKPFLDLNISSIIHILKNSKYSTN